VRSLPGARTLSYALTIALGLVLDVSGVLHVYGLSALISQLLAAGTALVLTAIAVGWLALAAHARPAAAEERGARVSADPIASATYT